MLVVAGGNESALSATKRVLTRRDMKLEATVVIGNDGLHALLIFRIGNRDPRPRERTASLGIDHRPGDAIRARRNLRILGVRRLCLSDTCENSARRQEHSYGSD